MASAFQKKNYVIFRRLEPLPARGLQPSGIDESKGAPASITWSGVQTTGRFLTPFECYCPVYRIEGTIERRGLFYLQRGRELPLTPQSCNGVVPTYRANTGRTTGMGPRRLHRGHTLLGAGCRDL